jgi:alpha-glucosidase
MFGFSSRSDDARIEPSSTTARYRWIAFSSALTGLLCNFALGAAAVAASSDSFTLLSPNKEISIEIWPQDAGALPRYAISRKGEVVIAPSTLRLHLVNDPDFASFEVVNTRTRSVDESYELIAAKTAKARDHFNELTVSLVERNSSARRLDLVFRAYDDGAAFRYLIPEQQAFPELKLRGEDTQFVFPADYACYGLNIGRVDSSHEGEYDSLRAHRIREFNILTLPLTCTTTSGANAFAITEADLRDWAGMYLSGFGSGELGVDVRLPRRVDDTSASVRRSMTPEGIQSPWRVVMLGDHPGKLIESNLITNLNPPSKIADTSWIKPGKTAWDWWSGPYLPPPAKGGTDMPTIKRYIDFAAASGFPYMLIDEGWCLNSGVGGSAPDDADVTRTKADIDMPQLVKYARDRKVDLLLWVQWKLLDRQLDAALAQYEKWGIKGIKVDFMDRNDQQMVDYYHRVMAKAADHKLMVNMHGAYTPTGLIRTYPNYVTQEGVLGAEYNKWSKRVTATHNVTLAYTRNLLGPMDYTPGGFRNTTPAEFKITNSPPMVQTTRGQALAMFVVYDSPLQMVADSPDIYEKADGFEFLKAVPTMWDETRFIAGEIAEYVVVARRKGNEWYIGAMNNEKPRTIEVPLKFLGDGRFTLTSWEDGATPTTLNKKDKQKIGASNALKLTLAASGGAVARVVAER